MSLRHVAAKAKITAPYLSDIELGRRHPSERVLADLAKALRTEIEELRQHDPKALFEDIRERIDFDGRYAAALRQLLQRYRTAEDLQALLDA